jgi:thiosulfate reductase cytochrome b subunit
MPETGLWTAEDEITPLNSWIALPGRNNLGLGRHWHFWSGAGWLITGIAMSPALAARFPWILKLFGGRQSVRSLHFLGICIYVLFIIIHVALVIRQ